ncbi:hypothetical protein CRG98_031755 [Punica granatum]|uniref:Uncharacterized protein n=1 Tax=Punica granatum TaxID=22663 RepID=A0A2I0IV25_PUNGR|nr:hypothetical protein CRG98_031755 [Punica granatum]
MAKPFLVSQVTSEEQKWPFSVEMHIRRSFLQKLNAECLPSAPHFGPPTSHTRIPDRSPGHYSSPSHQRQISGRGVMNNRRKAGSLRKADEGHRKNLRVKNPENDGAGTMALFITESPKHRKVPNMGLQKSLSVPK